MRIEFKIIAVLIALNLTNSGFSYNYKYILRDECIENLFKAALEIAVDDEIVIIRQSQGIIIRFPLADLKAEYYGLSDRTLKNIKRIEKFLAKIKNTVIIEVHTDGAEEETVKGLKNWEVSAVIADNIRETTANSGEIQAPDRILSVGYGEFLPSKNTPYSGVKFLNRVDIIILCNVSGE